MLTEFSLDPPPALPVTVNIFFIVLSLCTAVVGGYSALQFTEALIGSTLKRSGSNKGARTFLILIAASFSIAVNAIFVMHMLAMSSVVPTNVLIRYSLTGTIGSIFCIFSGAFIAYILWTFHRDGIFGVHETSPLVQGYYSAPDESAPWRDHINFIVKSTVVSLRPRLFVAGSFLGVGILAMHYVGMNAMRAPIVAYYNPIMVGFEVLIGPVAGSALICILFSCIGLKKRLLGAVILGVASSIAHWYGYLSGTYCGLQPGQMMMNMPGEILVDGEVMCVVLILISSVVRFAFMGLISK